MKKALGIAMLVLMATVGGASAEDVKGTVKTVDAVERVITLEDGTQIWVAEGVQIENVKVGTSVKVSYEVRDGKKVATSIETE